MNEKIQMKLNKLLKVECQGCGGCCTKTLVPVTDSDIKRLVKRTGKSADEIVRLYDSTDVSYDAESDGWIRMKYGKRFLGLKKKNGKCQFLDENNRCQVYEDRPATCRTFPLQIHLDENDKITNVSLNRIIKSSYPLGEKQPINRILTYAKMEEKEDQQFYNKVQSWNSNAANGGKKEFLKFLGVK